MLDFDVEGVYICVYVCMYECIFTCTYKYTYIYMYICIWICISIYVYTYIYITTYIYVGEQSADIQMQLGKLRVSIGENVLSFMDDPVHTEHFQGSIDTMTVFFELLPLLNDPAFLIDIERCGINSALLCCFLLTMYLCAVLISFSIYSVLAGPYRYRFLYLTMVIL
jgi:hypothetical protein